MSDDAPTTDPADPTGDAVPRLPRGRGLKLSRPELLRIAGLAALLVFLIVTQRPCADAMSKFVTSFGDQGSAARAMPRPGTVDVPAGGIPAASSAAAGSAAAGSAAAGLPDPAAAGIGRDLDGYEHLRPGMTDDELKAAISRARVRAAGGSGSASGDPP